ncbi:hypothetical protein D3C77_505230 [compost metagenome]
MQEIDEGALQLVEVALVGAHVIGIDIGDHRHHRLQVQETGVALVGLGDQVAAAAQLGIGARRVQPAADDERGVQPGGGEHRRQQAGGGGLAMGAGHRDAMPVAHQLGEHLGTRHHGNASLQRMGDFRVALVDGAGDHQHIGFFDILRVVTDEHIGAETFQPRSDRRGLDIRAGNLVPHVEQHLGDAAHADSADTDEVDTPDAAHAPGFSLGGGGRLSHGPPPGNYPPPGGWHRAWPDRGRWRPWPRVVAVASAPRSAARPVRPHQ